MQIIAIGAKSWLHSMLCYVVLQVSSGHEVTHFPNNWGNNSKSASRKLSVRIKTDFESLQFESEIVYAPMSNSC
jgi:hypothetical protein